MNSSGLKGVGLGRANKIFLRNVVHLDKVIIGTIIFYNMFVNHASLRFVYSLTWEARLTIPLNKNGFLCMKTYCLKLQQTDNKTLH